MQKLNNELKFSRSCFSKLNGVEFCFLGKIRRWINCA